MKLFGSLFIEIKVNNQKPKERKKEI